jgi:hypothetical protein
MMDTCRGSRDKEEAQDNGELTSKRQGEGQGKNKGEERRGK